MFVNVILRHGAIYSCAEQNLYAQTMQLVGDRDPRAHEFSAQLRGMDALLKALVD